MKLFLSGGGSGQESFLLDKKFIETIDVSKPVLYIPIAMDATKHPYPECLEWLKGNFAPLNFDNFIMWTEENLKDKTKDDFEQFGGVYIGGGNTFKLLSQLKECGTFEILKDLAQKDVPIYGGSAGAIVITKSIITASYLDENKINLNDFSALNLIECDIWCHYKTSMNSDIEEFKKDHNLGKIIAIPEDSGIFVSKQEIEVVGQNNVYVFGDDKKTIHSGEFIDKL